ncbi:hypothetical protein HPP92_026642 [Vanilla planifolia]|uniref:Uncharacterized protein n=1 Tax=Vanilla planifolia TaxID=51239 RepID=A0A835PGC6_VANPL|nr:hypothetical protein HPP92_026642 [Vanilla planifolia]
MVDSPVAGEGNVEEVDGGAVEGKADIPGVAVGVGEKGTADASAGEEPGEVSSLRLVPSSRRSVSFSCLRFPLIVNRVGGRQCACPFAE